MAPVGPDASNACLPALTSPVLISVPPVPSCERGQSCPLDGRAGRLSGDAPMLAYTSGKMIVVRNLSLEDSSNTSPPPPLMANQEAPTAFQLPTLVYRGHHGPTTAVKISSSGAYVASGDDRGTLRVWALDHPEHLCKYTAPSCLTGPIRDIDWDGESKRLTVVGDRSADARTGDCAKVLQWDTGVSVGQLAQHLKGRAASVAVKPTRPFRIVTAGKDDAKIQFHQGPPFAKVPAKEGVPCETAHTKGAVSCVRYSASGQWVVSVGSDRSICLYDGKTMALADRLEQVHTATIYSCAWSGDDQTVMTASGDGTCKLFQVSNGEGGGGGSLKEVRTWKPAEAQFGKEFDKVPVGGNQLGCAFIKKGTVPVSVGLNGQLSLLPVSVEKNSPSDISVLTGHYASIASLTVDMTHKLFYTGDTDGILCQWDLNTCKAVKRLESPEGNADLMYVCHGGAISGVATTTSGSVLSVGWDDCLYVADAATGTITSAPTKLLGQPCAISAGSKIAAVLTVAGVTVVQDSGAILAEFPCTNFKAQTVCVSADDSTIYVGGDDSNIHVYKVKQSDYSLSESHVIDGHRKPVHSLAISHDGTKLASADESDICVWDITDKCKTIVARGRWCFHVQRVTCLTWSLDDTVLASGGADDSIYLWSPAKKMKRVHYPYAHRGGLTGLEFVDTNKLLSTGADATVNLWEVAADVKEKFG